MKIVTMELCKIKSLKREMRDFCVYFNMGTLCMLLVKSDVRTQIYKAPKAHSRFDHNKIALRIKFY